MRFSNGLRAPLSRVAILVASLSLIVRATPDPKTVSGTAAVTADWTQDAPGVKHKITLEDLPAPYATKSASNSPREVRRPPDLPRTVRR